MARRLTQLKIHEVSGVDRGAGIGVKVMLMKRLGLDTSSDHDDSAYMTLTKRTFTADERKTAEANGHAMAGGRYPINDVADLENAIRAVGRGKGSHAAIRAHIIARAAALGASDKIPDDWKTNKVRKWIDDFVAMLRKQSEDGEARDFNAVHDAIEAGEYAQGMVSEICEAVSALQISVGEIMSDDDTPDKASALKETFDQFKEHIQGVVPEEYEKGLAAAIAATFTKSGDQAMTIELRKALGLGDKATDADIAAAVTKLATTAASVEKLIADNKALTIALEKAGLSDDEKSFHDGLPNEDAQAAFRNKSKDDRAAQMKKRNDDLPEHVRKALADGEAMAKRLAMLEEQDATTKMAKRATDIGMPEEFGETIKKARGGDVAAVTKLEDTIKGLIAQVKQAGLFREIGGVDRGAGGASAYDQLMAKAGELQKSNPKLTSAQAFEKVYTDRANAELVKQYKIEDAGGGRRAA